MAGTGMTGTSPITSPGTARMSSPAPMTRRVGSRSASELNNAPPTACGAKPMLNARAVRNGDLVWAKTMTDRPRISNSKPRTYMSSAANSTRNSPVANTERYVVRAGRDGGGRSACRLAPAGVRAVMHAIVRAGRAAQYSFVTGRKLVGRGASDRGAQRGPDHEPVRAVAALGTGPGPAAARGRAAPAGRARAPPLAGPRQGSLPGAGPRGGHRRDPRAAAARMGRGLPVAGS